MSAVRRAPAVAASSRLEGRYSSYEYQQAGPACSYLDLAFASFYYEYGFVFGL